MQDVWDTRTGDLVGSFESVAEANERIRLLTEAEPSTVKHWFQVSHAASRVEPLSARHRVIREVELARRIG